MAVTCSAIAKAGSRCSRPALAGAAFCLMHSPDHAEMRREASRKGGRNRSAQARARAAIPEAMDAAELGGWLTTLFRGVITGRIEPKIGTAAATIARTMMEVRTAVELEQRIAELEERAGTAERGMA